MTPALEKRLCSPLGDHMTLPLTVDACVGNIGFYWTAAAEQLLTAASVFTALSDSAPVPSGGAGGARPHAGPFRAEQTDEPDDMTARRMSIKDR